MSNWEEALGQTQAGLESCRRGRGRGKQGRVCLRACLMSHFWVCYWNRIFWVFLWMSCSSPSFVIVHATRISFIVCMHCYLHPCQLNFLFALHVHPHVPHVHCGSLFWVTTVFVGPQTKQCGQTWKGSYDRYLHILLAIELTSVHFAGVFLSCQQKLAFCILTLPNNRRYPASPAAWIWLRPLSLPSLSKNAQCPPSPCKTHTVQNVHIIQWPKW